MQKIDPQMDETQYKKLLEDNLMSIEDTELILLKGHLIIEQLITKLLEFELVDPSRLSTISPMFSKKLEMYLAVAGNSIISEGLEKVIKDLNNLRNKLAHNLNHPNFDHLLIDWVQKAAKQKLNNNEDNKEIKEMLISAISQIAAFLSGSIIANQHLTNG
jgi:hypothetical protein